MKTQFKIYLSGTQITELEQAAEKHGRRSAQAVVEEVLEFYLPVWDSVQSSVAAAVNRQAQSVVRSNVGSIEPTEAVLADDINLEDFNKVKTASVPRKRKVG